MRCARNPLRPRNPRRPSRPRKGRRRRAHADGNFCLDRDRLSAAGHKGGDFEARGPRDQPRHDRRAEASRSDRRRDPRPQPGAPFAYVTTRKFLEAFGFASLRDLPDLERLKAEGLIAEHGRERMISIARLGWRKRCRTAWRTTTLFDARKSAHTTLPRLGSRVRIPSPAPLLNKRENFGSRFANPVRGAPRQNRF